jgi:hypothetical protein
MKELMSRQGLELSVGRSGGIGFFAGGPLHESGHFVSPR